MAARIRIGEPSRQPRRKHVTNYAQWRSQADLDAMMSDPAARSHMREAADIADSFEPISYDLRETHSGEGAA